MSGIQYDISKLTVRLLGSFQIADEAEELTALYKPRLQALLTYLLLHRDAPQPRLQVAFLLWPDSTDIQARNSLRNLLSQLRKALPDADRFLNIDTQSIQWRKSSAYWLDIDEFEDTMRKSRDRASVEERCKDLEYAASLYCGELVPGCYDDWILPIRESLYRLYIEALQELIQLLEDQRHYREAIQHGEQLLDQDPLHESTYRTLMRLYAATHNHPAALRTYRNCQSILKRELDVEPSQATQAAYEMLLNAQVRGQSTAHLPSVQQSTVDLVGRQFEWQTLHNVWRTLQWGQSQIVLLKGEAGIGKTHIAEQFLEWATSQGFRTAKASCYAAEGALAYAPIVSWLRAEPLRTTLDELDDVWLGELATLLPELRIDRAGVRMPSEPPPARQRQQLFEALVQAFLRGDQPLLLLLDDLQWCDRETLEWIHYLLRSQHGLQLLIVCTLRSEELLAEHAVNIWLFELRRGRRLIEINLQRLSETETAALAELTAGRQLDTQFKHDLYVGTEGNPLFVVETVLTNQFAAEERQLSLPPHIQTVIESRLTQLGPDAREVANLAAVIGRDFTYEVLQHASDDSESKVVQGLNELWQRQIVREQGADAYVFSHDKIRQVVYASMSLVHQRHLHRKIGNALAELYTEDVETISGQAASHFQQAGSLDQAVRYYVRAAQYATRVYAYHRAAAFYNQAINIVGKLNLPSERLIELYVDRGRVLELAGRYAEAIEIYRSLESQARRRADREMECIAVERLLTCYIEPTSVHDRAQAEPLFERSLALARKLDDRNLVVRLLRTRMAYESHYGSDVDGKAAGEEAVLIARQNGLERRLAYALNDLAILLRLSGHLEQGHTYADEARRLFQEMEILPMLADNLGQQTWSDFLCLDFESALSFAAECETLSREIDNGWNLSIALFIRGLIHYMRGRWGEAIMTLEEAIDCGRDAGFVMSSTLMPTSLGALLREIGQTERAQSLHSQAHETCMHHTPFLLHAVEAQLAMDSYASGETHEGDRWLQAAREREPRGAIARAWITFADLAVATVRSAEQNGKWTDALQFVEQALIEAEQRRIPLYWPTLNLAYGQCLEQLGRLQEAEAKYLEAITAASSTQLVAISWRDHAAMARLYASQSREKEATSHRRSASRIVIRLADSLDEPAYRRSFLACPDVRPFVT